MPRNGRLRPADVTLTDGAKVITTDRVDMTSEVERRRFSKRVSERLGEDAEAMRTKVEAAWAEVAQRQAEAVSAAAQAGAEGADVAEVLEAAPDVIRRPLCLVGGRSYAAAWPHVRTTTAHGRDEAGQPVHYDPPRVETARHLAVVRDDGAVFSDGRVPGARPLAQLGVAVRLPAPVPPGSGWSGSGVKWYAAGDRPDPADVFGRVRLVVDAHVDFNRSLAPQGAMCDLVACYVLAGYLLGAFDVIGYMWPNGDKGAGKTQFLAVLTELAYLGQLVLAGGSYASLRDLADYGATLAFDDTEGVMDVRRADPDKRTLLLAGNRRGATVTVKDLEGERWVTRFIHTFCPRAFSAIRLPDDVLASRTVVVPLVRSGDGDRARSQPAAHASWPCDRRRLVDDLWAVGVAGLPRLRANDARAAADIGLLGRELEPWRAVLAVALWLEECHGVAGLSGRMATLVEAYRTERGDLEVSDPVRVAVRALRGMVRAAEGAADWDGALTFTPKDLAGAMNAAALEDDLSEPDKPLTNPKRVGWMLRRLRFRRAERDEKNKRWAVTPADVAGLVRSYGLAD
jgi:hypothetical protein